jgi:uncharacterized membrane protein (UPF0127 family)
MFVFVWSMVVLTSCKKNAEKQNESVGDESKTDEILENTLPQGELTFYDEENNEITSIVIEIAEDDYSRSFGLMFREKLPVNQGMFFIFDTDEVKYFWMKNTPLSLDMIFVNKDKVIVKIRKNTKPFSLQTYSSVEDARYVVEVNAGFTDSFAIGEGNKILWKKY